jgi:hypothetical protein
MKILIADVTEMHQGNYCVAGWCFQSQSMIRPLPGVGANWTANMLLRYGIAPGATIQFDTIGQPNSDFPHRTEDTLIDPSTIRQINADPAIWPGRFAIPAASTLAQAFDGSICCNSSRNGYFQGVYVPFQTQTRSLYAVSVMRGGLSFFEDDNKLRAYLDDGSGRYKLAVTSRALKETYRANGIEGVIASLPYQRQLHVRVGLARAWGEQPDKCYVMINGVYW